MSKRFFQCGILGLALEILWTGFLSFRKRERKLTGQSSLWMFPIYGCAALIAPISRLLKHSSILVRGSLYTVLIFSVEFVTGTLLKRKGACPWDYGDAKYNIDGVIRLDYAPLWFLMGLLYEKIPL